jgi:hypothetical protein
METSASAARMGGRNPDDPPVPERNFGNPAAEGRAMCPVRFPQSPADACAAHQDPGAIGSLVNLETMMTGSQETGNEIRTSSSSNERG